MQGREHLKENNHNAWKGGKILKKEYFYCYCPNHPFTTKQKYVAEHRLVWEHTYNAILLPWSAVHHKNGITTDNKPENLEAMMKYKHSANHMREIRLYINTAH